MLELLSVVMMHSYCRGEMHFCLLLSSQIILPELYFLCQLHICVELIFIDDYVNIVIKRIL